MRVNISPSDISLCALHGADIHRFIGVLGRAVDPIFEAVDIKTAWGLVICVFYGEKDGQVVKATRPMNIDLLKVTKDLVIKDDGTFVDRYEKIVEELLLTAAPVA